MNWRYDGDAPATMASLQAEGTAYLWNLLAKRRLALLADEVGMGKQESTATLTMGLCNGGEITIPIGDKDEEYPRDCQSMACHAATSREKAKRFCKGNLI